MGGAGGFSPVTPRKELKMRKDETKSLLLLKLHRRIYDLETAPDGLIEGTALTAMHARALQTLEIIADLQLITYDEYVAYSGQISDAYYQCLAVINYYV